MSVRWSVTRLAILVLTLVSATALLPWPLASWWTGTSWSTPHDLARAVGHGLAGDWRLGVATPGAGDSTLADPARFWRWFHVAKGVLATAVLVAAALLSRQVRGADHQRFRAVGMASGALAGIAGLVVIANVQGAVAPLTSVLGFLPEAPSEAGLAPALAAVRDQLADGPSAALTDALVTDFARYHAALAVMSAVAALHLAVVAAAIWRRGHRRPARLLFLPAAFGAAVLTAANVSSTLDPASALDGFLQSVPG